MTDDRQPNTTDFRKRRASPVYVETLFARVSQWADTEANDYSEHVADAGGEVLSIRAYIDTDATGDYPAPIHYRSVTYRAQCRIAPPAKPTSAYSGDDE